MYTYIVQPVHSIRMVFLPSCAREIHSWRVGRGELLSCYLRRPMNIYISEAYLRMFLFQGTTLRNGRRLPYKLNGFACMVASLSAVVVLHFSHVIDLAYVSKDKNCY